MFGRVDYDDRQHAVYVRGRALSGESIARWMEAFAGHAPGGRPLTVLDLGSGTGRFTPALAETFGGDTFGVEPSTAMRVQAETGAAHPRVRYLAGRAEAIPLPNASCDLVLMFLSLHHVEDRPAAAREIARVLKPEGRLLVRSTFSDRMTEHRWHRYFPTAREIEMRVFPTLNEVVAIFEAVGFRPLAFDRVETSMAPSLADYAEGLKLRAISIFELMDEVDIARGFETLAAAVAAETEPQAVLAWQDFLVFGRD